MDVRSWIYSPFFSSCWAIAISLVLCSPQLDCEPSTLGYSMKASAISPGYSMRASATDPWHKVALDPKVEKPRTVYSERLDIFHWRTYLNQQDGWACSPWLSSWWHLSHFLRYYRFSLKHQACQNSTFWQSTFLRLFGSMALGRQNLICPFMTTELRLMAICHLCLLKTLGTHLDFRPKNVRSAYFEIGGLVFFAFLI